MEQIKTYVDCPRCVFVLAVDEKVVYDGIRKKLGDKVDEGRKKMLFDKLVQVPLHIPISAYNLNEYIKGLLKDEKELSSEFVDVINILVNEPNPRSIKRYINTTYLYRCIVGKEETVEAGSFAMLFAAVILRVESAQGFEAIVACPQNDEEHFTENLKAALEPLSLDDRINWAMLPTLWRSEDGAGEDEAKRGAFISWIQKLK